MNTFLTQVMILPAAGGRLFIWLKVSYFHQIFWHSFQQSIFIVAMMFLKYMIQESGISLFYIFV